MIRIIEEIISSFRAIPRKVIDEVKFRLIQMTNFYDYVSRPLTSTIRELREIDIPSSTFYNKFLSNIESDINLIYSTQELIRNNLLSSWNVIETSYPEEIQPPNPYDEKITLEHDEASVISDRISLGVKSFSSVIPKIKDKPILRARSSDTNVPVYYGKVFGIWAEGNESGEDGIRYENNDGSLIIDEKDTFWETETTVLQESRDDTTFLQSIYDKDISLYTTIKIIFTEPVDINTLTIIPYSAAVSAYYRLLKIEVSDGIKVFPLDIEETFVIGETTFVFDLPEELEDQKVRSIFITLKQETGYFMKYMLGYFKIKNNESWVDITGPHVTQLAKSRGENFNANVSYVIEHAPEWILHYWLPGITFDELPELITDEGTDGYITVPSSESKRKRYTIGITDIKIGSNEYHDISEKVTNVVDIPDGYNTVSVKAIDQGDVTYFLSFDGGMTWDRILPVGREPIRGDDLRLVPSKLYINSDLSLKRRKNTDTGEQAFIDTTSKSIKLRFVLKRTEGDLTLPAVLNWNLEFGVN